jgi:hypothetical protein
VIFFGECVNLGHKLVYIRAWCDVWLWYILHIFIDGIHVVNVGRWVAATVLGEVACFSAVKAWSLGAPGSIILLDWGVCHIVVFRLGGVGVGVVVLVLTSIVGHSSVGQVHWYWDVVIGRSRSIGGVICWPLLLLLRPLLILLGSSSQGARSELSLALVVVEPSRIW